MDIFYDIDIYKGLVIFSMALVFIYLVNGVCKCILLSRKPKKQEKEHHEGVSIVITANNRAEDIRENLTSFLEQDYPQFEVIIVDECSEDDTQDVLADFQETYPHLRTTRIFPGAKFRSTKKLAINLGILAAKYDIVLFTQISSRPATPNWVRLMESYFTDKVSVVVGYANFDADKKRDIPRIFRFRHFIETFFLFKCKQYVSGEGFNMGCRKSSYLPQKVFSKNSHSYSGYDSDIVKALSKCGEVNVVKDTDAAILLNDNLRKTWGERMAYYYNNKRKWSSFTVFCSNYELLLRWLIYGVS
ncbi:glycosyltransferase, partial [Odoribacter sp. OttesenSCG-928-A06]|nr:glycosyltransferase [Odoribacter sp. OttesenSCG-928-A06]